MAAAARPPPRRGGPLLFTIVNNPDVPQISSDPSYTITRAAAMIDAGQADPEWAPTVRGFIVVTNGGTRTPRRSAGRDRRHVHPTRRVT
jgi:hypothetical protein